MTLLHDSRDAVYRVPGGARPCGDALALCLRCDPAPDAAYLRLWWDDREILVDMTRGEDDLWRAQIETPEHPGLLWYYFIADYGGRRVYYGNADDCLGGVGCARDAQPPAFQVTVYDPAYDTPRWMREGVIYQIMVDRFAASQSRRNRPAPENGHFHADWYEPPELVQTSETDLDGDFDFFGGDLRGIAEKLPYLADLGVTALYLNPIFRAISNHKYDTGDYEAVDPTFGTAEDFQALCEAASARGIRVLLDGVFSHTGAISRYFNRDGRYDSVGAYQSEASPYAAWYQFDRFPDDYQRWWGFYSLPNVHEMTPSYLDFILRNDNAVCARWLRAGASGWRLDVADELPMRFIEMMRARVKRENPEAALLGEVWENASNKVSYGELRSYCLGATLDSCMNYPLRAALVDFMTGLIDAAQMKRRLDYLGECYPAPFFYALMNLLGSHDKPRAIDVFAQADPLEPPYAQRHARTLSPDQYDLGARRFRAAWAFICAFPGMPGLYYGDEAGNTGMSDPFCRATYPWGREDQALLSAVRDSIARRNKSPVLRTGCWRLYAPAPDAIALLRYAKDGKDAFGAPMADSPALFVLNRGDQPIQITLPQDDLIAKSIVIDVPPISGIAV